MRCRSLEKGCEFTTLLSRQRARGIRRDDNIRIQVHADKVLFGEFNFIIPPLDSNDIRAGGLSCQSSLDIHTKNNIPPKPRASAQEERG